MCSIYSDGRYHSGFTDYYYDSNGTMAKVISIKQHLCIDNNFFFICKQCFIHPKLDRNALLFKQV
jgi:hypothetical protein